MHGTDKPNRTMHEFELIAAIRRSCSKLPANGFEGIGDDCAVLPLPGGEALVFTCDALGEGVHFLRAATSPEELGAKALAVNLSDVASMGVRPVATLLALSLPDGLEEEWAERFIDGYTAFAERCDVALIGGDTTRSLDGIALSITAIGRGPLSQLKRRRDARPGDTIFVSDRLGASAAGLRDILEGRLHTPAAAIHRNPLPEIEAGEWLGRRSEVHAMMDISDGIASDLRHILEASEVGAEVELEAVPIAEGATLRDALCGGEDYKLLFTADGTAAESLARDFEAAFGRPLHPIGRISDSGLVWLRNGRPADETWQGFRHF